MEMTYKVQVKVPLGIRKGKMWLQVNNGIIVGELELLGTVEKIEGVLSKDGAIHLKGNLASPIRCITYTGTGTIRNGTIQLKMENGRNIYLLTGVLLDEKGISKDEEVL